AGNPVCACVGCTATASINEAQAISVNTGDCNAPFINSFAVQATDSSTYFRIWTTTSGDANPSDSFLPLGSSTLFTGDAVSCFMTTFTPGVSTALISTDARDLYIVLVCASPV